MRVTVSEASRCGPRPWGSTITRCPVPHNQTSGSSSAARRCAGAGGARGRRWCSATARRGPRRSGRRSPTRCAPTTPSTCGTCPATAPPRWPPDKTSSLGVQGGALHRPARALGPGRAARRRARLRRRGGPARAPAARRAVPLAGAGRRRRAGPVGIGVLPARRRARGGVRPAPAAAARGAACGPTSAAPATAASRPRTSTCSPRRGSARRGQAAFYRQIAQADQRYTDEIEPLLPGVDLPVQVVWGTEDTWIPVDRAHRLAALIPGARLDLRARRGAPHPARRPAPPHGRAGALVEQASTSDGSRMARSQRGGLGRAERDAWGWRPCSRSAAATSWSSWTSPSSTWPRPRSGVSWSPPSPTSSGSSTATRSRSRACCSSAARWATAGATAGCSASGWPCSPVSSARLRRRAERPHAHGVPAASRAAAPPCSCPARSPCCSRSTARRRPGRGPSGCGARSRAWRPPQARSSAAC